MSYPARTIDTDVLIIGGGGCGLSASVFLADAGVNAYLVERHPGTAIMPKAHILNPRTMEIFAQHGLAEEVYARGAKPEENKAMRWLTGLGGDQPWDRRPLHTVDAWGGGALADHYREVTASRHGNLPQILLEPLLRRHAEERSPGLVHFHHEVVDLERGKSDVRVHVVDRDTAERYLVRARYVIAADGGKTIGPLLGIPMVGPKPFVTTISVYFRADLSPYLDSDDACVRSFIRPDPEGEWTRTGLIAIGPEVWGRHSSEWVATVTLTTAEEAREFDEVAAADAVRARLNLPDLELDVLRFTRWQVEGVYSEHFTAGRVFLAGDAAHRHSPMGGLGLNSGIQDAHNLSWKLAAVVRGEADSRLLDSYELERLPVTRRNVEFATFAFFNHLTAASGFGMVPGAPAEFNRDILERLFSDTQDGATRRVRLRETFNVLRLESQATDLELGFSYSDSPVVVPDGTVAPPRDPEVHRYVPVARPGHRLPHAWVRRGERRVGTHDLVRPGRLTLITGAESAAWEEAAASARAEHGAAVDVVVVGPEGDLQDVDGVWSRLRQHDDSGAILVRPDGHVAFRGFDAEAASDLVDAMGVVLGKRQIGEPAEAREMEVAS